MGTTADKLKRLKDTKTAIGNAIAAKGVKVLPADKFDTYGPKIRSIVTKVNPVEQLNKDFARIGYNQTDINYSILNPAEYDTKLKTDLDYSETKYKAWNPSRTNAADLYLEDKKLVYAPKIDTSNVDIMVGIFSDCSSLTMVPKLNTSKVIDMGNMFGGCLILTTVPKFDTSKVTTMNHMFYNCQKLINVPDFNTNSLTDISHMFSGCSSLIIIPQFDTSSVTNMQNTFEHCYLLTTIPLLNAGNVIYANYMFNKCISLTNLGGFKNLKVSLNLSASPKLTKQSLLNVINNLATITTNQTLTLGQANIDKLTAEEIAIGTNKGWNVTA